MPKSNYISFSIFTQIGKKIEKNSMLLILHTKIINIYDEYQKVCKEISDSRKRVINDYIKQGCTNHAAYTAMLRDYQDGTKTDDPKLVKKLNRMHNNYKEVIITAAKKGSAECNLYLGLMYCSLPRQEYNHIFLQIGSEQLIAIPTFNFQKNNNIAVEYLKAAVNSGSSNAAYELAEIYLHEQELSEAVKWYKVGALIENQDTTHAITQLVELARGDMNSGISFKFLLNENLINLIDKKNPKSMQPIIIQALLDIIKTSDNSYLVENGKENLDRLMQDGHLCEASKDVLKNYLDAKFTYKLYP